jgi:hypothetical protein
MLSEKRATAGLGGRERGRGNGGGLRERRGERGERKVRNREGNIRTSRDREECWTAAIAKCQKDDPCSVFAGAPIPVLRRPRHATTFPDDLQ